MGEHRIDSSNLRENLKHSSKENTSVIHLHLSYSNQGGVENIEFHPPSR